MSKENGDPPTLFKSLRIRFENHPILVVLIVITITIGAVAALWKDVVYLAEQISDDKIRVGTPDEPIRLKAEEIQNLVVGMIEQGKLITPTYPEFEGRPNTWYSAYYFADGKMLYLRSVSRSAPDNWEWYIDQNGNLCRGPELSKKRSCRSVVSIGENRYRSVGFRTGNIRNEFYMEEGTHSDLR